MLEYILEIGEPLSKYWKYIGILVAPKIWYFGVKDGGKPKISLAAVKSGEKCPNFSEGVLND